MSIRFRSIKESITQQSHVPSTCIHVHDIVHVCISYKRDHYVFYEHVDMRVSSLRYIELKRLDNDIKTKSISKTCTNYETKGKQRQKVPQRYNLYNTSEPDKLVASKQRREIV